LAAIGGEDTDTLLRPYLEAPAPQVRMAALEGLLKLGGLGTDLCVLRALDQPKGKPTIQDLGMGIQDLMRSAKDGRDATGIS